MIPVREHFVSSVGTLILGVLFCLHGCGSGSVTVSERPEGHATTTPDEQAVDLALRHYVAGSAHEENGDFESAVREYRQALRYDRSPVILAALSRNCLELERFTEAAEHAAEAVRLAPEDLRAHEQLADVYLAMGLDDSAAARYEIMFRVDSTNEQTRYTLARLYHDTRPDRALQLYQSILHGNGEDDDVMLDIAELHVDQGRYAEAASILESLRRFDADNDYILSWLADIYREDRQPEKALAVLQDLCDRFPEHQRYSTQLAESYAEMDRWKEARAVLDTVLASDTLDVEAAADIGEMYFQQALADPAIVPEAERVFMRLQERLPKDWHSWWYAGALAFNTGRMPEAARHFTRALELDPGNTETMKALARAALSMDDPAAAIKPLMTLADRKLADAEAYSYLGYAWQRLRKDSLAIDALDRALTLEPSRVDALTTLALIHDDARRFELSDSLYERALHAYEDKGAARDDGYYLILNNYAYSLADRGLSLSRALELSGEAVRHDSTNSSYLDTFGWVYYRLGDVELAKHYVGQAIEQSRSDPSPTLLEHMGDILMTSGDSAAAVSLWKQSQAIDPGNTVLEQKIRAATP